MITESDDKLVNLLREDEPRPKFFYFDYTFIRSTRIKAESDELGNDDTEIRHNPRFTLALRAPIRIKPQFQLIGEFKMKQEFFDFRNAEQAGASYLSSLDRRTLQNIGASVYMKKDLGDEKFLYGFWNGNLNSDDVSFNDFFKQLRTNIAVVYAKNINELTQIGFGGGFGYIFGDARVFPVLIYNQTFSDQLHLESFLPKSIKLRYTHSALAHSYGILDVNGASYFLRESTIEGYDELTFQRSAINLKYRLEREIYDWLWFSLEAGYNIPINLFISEPRKRRKNAIVILRQNPSPIFGISIFAVVPKKILYKRPKEG